MIECVMFFWGGFLAASLLALMLISVVHHRAVRLTRRRLEDSVPVSLVEMQSEKDQLRADFAMSTRRLEKRVEQLRFKAATQVSEMTRKTETIDGLRAELARKTAFTDELAQKVEYLTGRIKEVEREYATNAVELSRPNAYFPNSQNCRSISFNSIRRAASLKIAPRPSLISKIVHHSPARSLGY